MSEDVTADIPLPPPVPRGHPVVAWCVVGLIVAFVFYRNLALEAAARGDFDRLTLEIQGRYLVGVGDFFGKDKDKLLRQFESSDDKSYEHRLCMVVLAGELEGPEAALRRLGELPAKEGDDVETAHALASIYHAAAKKPPAAPPPEFAAEERVREKLGWFGELASVPPGTPDQAAREEVLRGARRTAMAVLALAAVALLGILSGLILLGLCVGLTATGVMRPRLTTGSPYGGIYAETFAAWFVLFLVLGLATRLVPLDRSRLLVSGLCGLISLGALAWPIARGVPWRTVRHDIGLSAGPRPGAELLAGFGTYVAALPLLAGGAAVSLFLLHAAKRLGYSVEPPSHPLGPFVAESGTWGRIQAFVLAAVMAPVLEETMFRGVLYRHLRESTAGLGRVASVLASAALVSFVFAIIHPQGWIGAAPLMGLALTFCLAREWRGSLLPAMVAHALNNAVVTVFLILVAG